MIGIFPCAYFLKQPHPWIGVPGLSRRCKDAQRGEIMLLDEILAMRDQCADQGG